MNLHPENRLFVLIALIALSLASCATNYPAIRQQITVEKENRSDFIVHTGPLLFLGRGQPAQWEENMKVLPAGYTTILEKLVKANMRSTQASGKVIRHDKDPIKPMIESPKDPRILFGGLFSSRWKRMVGESETSDVVKFYNAAATNDIVFVYQIVGLSLSFDGGIMFAAMVSIYDRKEKTLLSRKELLRKRIPNPDSMELAKLARQRDSLQQIEASLIESHENFLREFQATEQP